VLAGTQAMEFQAAADGAARYAWIESVLQRFDYRHLARSDRGPVRAYLQHLSGYSRAQITRLVSRWGGGQPLVKNYAAPRHPFARLYTPADVALLAEVDRAMSTLSGPATACVLRRQRDVFGDPRFARLGSLSVGHLYNLRHSAGYRNQRVALSKTQPSKNTRIGVRKAPAPEGRPGFIRIDSVHQGDLDGIKGLYHINAVDCVTQWQVVASVQSIAKAHLLSVIEQMLLQFPFEILGFHADNGGEYVNHEVARLLEKLRIEFTRSRPRHSNDNGLAETKNGAVVRKEFGFAHIPQRHATRFNTYCVEYLNPFLNFHRPCLFATDKPDANKPGRIKRVYRAKDAMTPLDKLTSLSEAATFMRVGITLEDLHALATALSDVQAAEELNEARAALFRRVPARTG
jgi:transposase InsO family protein